MFGIKVPLERKFSLVTHRQDNEFDEGWLNAYWAQKESQTWVRLEAEYRAIVLADAGAGKTHEALARAQIGVVAPAFLFVSRILMRILTRLLKLAVQKALRHGCLHQKKLGFI